MVPLIAWLTLPIMLSTVGAHVVLPAWSQAGAELGEITCLLVGADIYTMACLRASRAIGMMARQIMRPQTSSPAGLPIRLMACVMALSCVVGDALRP